MQEEDQHPDTRALPNQAREDEAKMNDMVEAHLGEIGSTLISNNDNPTVLEGLSKCYQHEKIDLWLNVYIGKVLEA